MNVLNYPSFIVKVEDHLAIIFLVQVCCQLSTQKEQNDYKMA